MPELPEVETVRRGLQPALEGAVIAEARAFRPDLRFPFPERFEERLTGARVERLERRAKYILAPLDTGETWVMHLGMSGRFTVTRPNQVLEPGGFYYAAAPDPKHTHVLVRTTAGAAVAYNDHRRFGYMGLLPSDGLEAHPWFAGLGPEPLSDAFDGRHLAAAFKGRTQNVKATLLDQRVVAGLGNIYVCEALHRARIHPERPAGAVGRARLDRLAETVKTVLAEAVENGGSTLRDYAGTDGALGGFQDRFRVYDREGDACLKPRCRGVVRRLVQGGRSTFFCAECQR
jgi:formamidopyrimidine-DNA glycosylase